LYVSDKLLVSEIAHQTVGKDLTKAPKESKKLLWPAFHVKCGFFSLENFNHVINNSVSMEAFKLHTLPKRKFDPGKVAYNITTVVKLKQYNHEDKNFEDLL